MSPTCMLDVGSSDVLSSDLPSYAASAHLPSTKGGCMLDKRNQRYKHDPLPKQTSHAFLGEQAFKQLMLMPTPGQPC